MATNVVTRNTVKLVNRITSSKDVNMERDETRNLVSTLLGEMCEKFAKSPRLVAAVLQHLKDSGFDVVNVIKSENTEKFIMIFGNTISKMNDVQLKRVREINNALFSINV